MRTLRHRCRTLADFTDDELRAEIARRWVGAHVPGASVPPGFVEVSNAELYRLIQAASDAISFLQQLAGAHQATAASLEADVLALRRQLGLLEHPDAMFLLAAEIAANKFELDEAINRTIGDR